MRKIIPLLAGALLSGQALSQNAPAQPAVQAAPITPIGKVVTAAGSVSIEREPGRSGDPDRSLPVEWLPRRGGGRWNLASTMYALP